MFSYASVVVSSVVGRCLLIVTYSGTFSLLKPTTSKDSGVSDTVTRGSVRSNNAFLDAELSVVSEFSDVAGFPRRIFTYCNGLAVVATLGLLSTDFALETGRASSSISTSSSDSSASRGSSVVELDAR